MVLLNFYTRQIPLDYSNVSLLLHNNVFSLFCTLVDIVKFNETMKIRIRVLQIIQPNLCIIHLTW